MIPEYIGTCFSLYHMFRHLSTVEIQKIIETTWQNAGDVLYWNWRSTPDHDVTAAPMLGYFFGITAQSAAGRLFPFTIVMYIIHNLEDHCELGSCFDRFEDQFDHTLTHSLPGAGFAAYRFLVYSLFIITCISTFVNRGNSKKSSKVLDKITEMCYTDIKGVHQITMWRLLPCFNGYLIR